MASFRYWGKDLDPSFLFADSAPQPRKAVWAEGEAVRVVKQAWRPGYCGLAALLAGARDTRRSTVDVRRLAASERRRDVVGTWFGVDRAKTGREAVGTLSRRAEYVLDAYIAKLGVELMGPIFRNRSGPPYARDTLGDDFRDVRALVFGQNE